MSEEEPDFMADTNEENHPAITTLRQLLENEQITAEVFNTLSNKFRKLHQAFSQSCSTEQILLRRTRELNKELKAQKLTIQNSAAQQQDHRTALTALRQHVTNIQSELEATREQIDSTKANTQLKHKERDKLEDKVAKAKDDRRLKLEPQKRQVQIEISNLEEEIKTLEKQIESLRQEGSDQLAMIARDEEQLAELEKKKRQANQKMLEIGSQPIKTRQKASSVESSHNTMLTEEKNANNALITAETTLQSLHTRAHDLETEHQHILNDIDGMVVAASDMKLKGEELRAKCVEQTSVKQQREYESRKILKHISEMNKEISTLDQKLDAGVKDINKKEKDSQKLEEAAAAQLADKKVLESQLKTLNMDVQKEEEHNSSLTAELNKAVESREAAFQQYVALEGITNEVMNEIKAARTDKDRKQAIHDQLSKKEHEMERQLTEASLIRDRKAREMAAMKKKTLDAKNQAMEANLDYLDLCRKQDMIGQKLKEYSDLYEKVKLDRNRYVNTIQTSRQLIVELKEKIRILDNEVEVLRKEFETIDNEVKMKKAELDQAFNRRNSTKSELKKAELLYYDLNQQIDFQSTETKRLKNVLRTVENYIKEHQKRFQIQADDCQNIQRLLIDKNDELCMIYEQFNKHEEVMKRGEIGLREREEEMRLLNLQLNDLQRRIDIMRRKVPQVRAYEEEIKDLDQQLEREKKDVDEITKKLEAPDEHARARVYCGRDFTLKELEQKVSTYEQRINAKEQQLWEKQILLREIEEKIEELSKDAQKDVSKTEKVFRQSGNMRAEAMSLRRKMMASAAERALYMGQKDVLEEEKQMLKEELDLAGQRTERGEAFDEYSTKILKMYERDQARKSIKQKGPFDEDDDDDEEKRPGRLHYDAYQVEGGLSRPYGAFPAFQPGPVSGNLRHYRNETQRPIEL